MADNREKTDSQVPEIESVEGASTSQVKKKPRAYTKFNPDKHLLPFGLKLGEIETENGVQTIVSCKFCLSFGREERKRTWNELEEDEEGAPKKKSRRRTKNIKTWDIRTFRSDVVLRHIRSQHESIFAKYQNTNVNEKMSFFEESTIKAYFNRNDPEYPNQFSHRAPLTDGEKRLVWIDCDPGHDDAFALVMAGYHPYIKLSMVSTVWGNQSLENTTINATKVLDLAGIDEDVPVIAGCSKPIIQQFLNQQKGAPLGEEWGFRNTKFPDLKANARKVTTGEESIAEGVGITRIAAYLKKLKTLNMKIHLIATGCLTNIAVLFTVYNQLMHETIASITIMGGAIGPGNMSPAAEFNILADPEAARIVFDNTTPTLPLTMVPLEVTHAALVTKDVILRVKNISQFGDNTFPGVMVSLLTCFSDTYSKIFGFEDPPLHDPVAVAAFISPELFEIEKLFVEVIVGEGSCTGQTVVDLYGMLSKNNKLKARQAAKQNVYVVKKFKALDIFWDMLMETLVRANEHSYKHRIIS